MLKYEVSFGDCFKDKLFRWHMRSNVYIIVLNWNGTEDTINCLISLKENYYSEYTTVLVDNGSEEQNLQELKKWCNNNYTLVAHYNRHEAERGGKLEVEKALIKISGRDKLVFIENCDNLGFAAGNNVALRYVLHVKASYAMLLNNDTIVEKNSIALLVEFMNSNKEYVAVTPQIRYFHPNDRVWNCGGKIMWLGNRKYYFTAKHISKVPQKGYKDISLITGCALLFKPQLTGILTEKFFFGEEDFDFSYRQKINKNRMACIFESIIYHRVNGSVTKVNFNNIGKVYLFYLSRLLNARQFVSPLVFYLIVMMNIGYAIPMVRIRYGFSIRQIFRMVFKILINLNKIDVIDKEQCMKCMNEDFRNPVIWRPWS